MSAFGLRAADRRAVEPSAADRPGVEPSAADRHEAEPFAVADEREADRREADRRAVELRGVGFAYPDGTRALDDVSLDIARGETVAIVGRNGSGKSTLVRMLNGLLRPTAGEVRVMGRPTAGRHVAELARTVGLAFQDPDRQLFAPTVEAEVRFGPRNLGLSGAELEAAVSGALEAVGLGGERATHPYDLGFSRRKLLGIASVLAMGTPIVVLDEPTTGQDAPGLERIRRLVADLAAAGRTVIAISHDMELVAGSFGRVVVMRAGRVSLDGTPATVFAGDKAAALAATGLEPPLAARVGERMGLGSTPTADALVAALEARSRRGPSPADAEPSQG